MYELLKKHTDNAKYIPVEIFDDGIEKIQIYKNKIYSLICKKKEDEKNIKKKLNIHEVTIDLTESFDYHGKFIWLKDFNCNLFESGSKYVQHKISIDKCFGTLIPQFLEYIDNYHVINFRNRFRDIDLEKVNLPKILTLNDIRDVVMYTILTNLSQDFITLFLTETMDKFLRCLIVYFQYYLQLWKIMKQRKELRKTKLLNPTSTNSQTNWKKNLNDLRYMVFRYFLKILLGRGDTKRFHHMFGSEVSQSQRDLKFYELMYILSTKIVIVVLNDENNKDIIHNEMTRLFQSINEEDNLLKTLGSNERDVLEDKFPPPKGWLSTNPLISEGLRPKRDPIFKILGKKYLEFDDERLKLLQAAYLMPENNLKKANIKLGILGDFHNEHSPLLFCKELKSHRWISSIQKEDVLKMIRPKGLEQENLITKHDPQAPYNLDESLFKKTDKRYSKEERIDFWITKGLLSKRFHYLVKPPELTK